MSDLSERMSSLEDRMDKIEKELLLKLDTLIQMLGLQGQLRRKDYYIAAAIGAAVGVLMAIAGQNP